MNPNLSPYGDILPLLERENINRDQGARVLLARNSKIAAVKFVMRVTSWGLRKSKEYVDQIEQRIARLADYD